MMAARAEALAKQFEAKAQEAAAVFERLSDADWKKPTSGEKWPVGVVAHHIATGHEGIAGIMKTVASGQSTGGLTMDMLNEMNAKHAQEHANCTKAETVALHKKNAASAASLIRGLSDTELGRSATVLQGMPPMTAEQLAGLLVSHTEEHLGNIRAAVGGSSASSRSA
jgi:DinB family protein